MKLQEKPLAVKRIGINNEAKYKIEANPIAFEILSTKLYKKPWLAVQRELAANGTDAHVDAGKPNLPLDIHLPNRFEPFFSIRDYGNGLNKEDLIYLYTTYFASSKRESDSQIGAFGLGACSTWAVTDSFTVTSINNGIKYSYLMFKGEDRTPNYSLIREEATNEPSGMEVRIGVKDSDIYKYQEDAATIYRYYKTRPNFSGFIPSVFSDQPNLSGTNWYTISKYGTHHNHMPTIVMGQIGYEFDVSLLKNIGRTAQQICQSGLIIKVDIGVVEPSASREELSYTKKTVAALEDALAKIEVEYSATVQKQIDTAPNYYEACLAAKNMPIYPSKALYKGKKLTLNDSFKLEEPITRFSYYGYSRKKVNENHYNGNQVFEIGFLSHIYEKDIDATSHARCIQEVERTQKTIWLVPPKELQKICTAWEYPIGNIPKVSSATYTPNTKTSTKVTGIYTITTGGWSRSTSVDFKTEPKGYYIGFYDKYIYNDNLKSKYIGPYNFRYLQNYIDLTKLNAPKVYGVQKDKMPRFVKQGWTNLLDQVKSEIDQLDQTIEYKRFCSYKKFEVTSHTMDLAVLVSKETTPIPGLSEFAHEYIQCYNIHKTQMPRYQNYLDIDALFFGKLQTNTHDNLNPLFREVLKKYDLLKVLLEAKVNAFRILKYIKETK